MTKTHKNSGYGGGNPRRTGRTHPVKQKKPNTWGIYDMHGNVWEWCRDWYGDYTPGPVKDPQGKAFGDERVLRGGSWYYDPLYLRSARRSYHAPDFRAAHLGFRIVLEEEGVAVKQ